MPSRVINFHKEGDVGVVTMDDGKANAMQENFFQEMLSTLDHAKKQNLKALVLMGKERIYCGGLDLKTLPKLTPEELHETLTNFYRMIDALWCFPAPVIAAGTGHALAGGFILYLCCDYRCAIDNDEHRYGLNEMVNGLPISHWTLHVVEHMIPNHHRDELILRARIMSPKETVDFGITHQLAKSHEEVLQLALTHAKAQGERLVAKAYGTTKTRLRRTALAAAWERDEAEIAGKPLENRFAHLAR